MTDRRLPPQSQTSYLQPGTLAFSAAWRSVRRMKQLFATLAASALIAAPVIASPAPKRSTCQIAKAPARDAKRSEPCRKPVIPPVIDQTPMFLASTAASPVALSDLS